MSTGELILAPFLFVSNHEFKDGYRFSHASGDGDFGWLAVDAEMLIPSSDLVVPADRHDGCHVYHFAYDPPASVNGSMALLLTTVVGNRRESDKSGCFTTIESAQVGQLTQQYGGGDWADSYTRLDDLGVLLEQAASRRSFRDFLVQGE